MRAAPLFAVPEPSAEELLSGAAAPPLVPGAVRRARLVRRLSRRDARLVALIAPARYRKTTGLRQWAESDDRPHVHVDLGAVGQDPAALLEAIWQLVHEHGSPCVVVLDD